MMPSRHGFMALLSLLAVGVLVAGAFLLDSPQSTRMKRIDRERISALQTIASNVRSSYERNKILPSNLNQLDIKDRSAGGQRSARNDPETDVPYSYQVLNDLRYELCATFSASVAKNERNASSDGWAHPAGRHCFRFNAASSIPLND
jgi:hypothetical protein